MKKLIPAILLTFLVSISSQAKSFDYGDKASMLTEIQAYNIAILPHLGDNLKQDKDFMFKAVEAFAPSLKHADSSLLSDKAFMLKLVVEEPGSLSYAADSLKKDKDVVWTAIFKNKHYENEHALKNAHPSLLKDKEFILDILRNLDLPASTLKYIDKSLQNDKNFILEAVKDDRGFLMMGMPSKWKNDLDVCKVAIKTSSHLLSYMGKDIQGNRAFVLKAVARKESGEALEHVSDALKKDREVVLAALQSSSLALKFVDPSLKSDKSILLIAAQTHARDKFKNELFFEMIEPKFREDKDILAILGK